MSLRLNYQAPGDNLNAWGVILNQQVFQRLEDALTKGVAFPLSGAKSLSTANGLEDEARCAFLDITSGTGGVITAPAVEKWYIVRNAAAGEVMVTTGGGAAAVVKPGEVGLVVGDGANFRRVQFTDLAGARLTGLGAPVDGQDAATRAYVDSMAFNEVDLPGQGPATDGQFIRSNGETAAWASLETSDVADYAADQADRAEVLGEDLKKFAIAMAVAL
ncbi:hypothetical protein [Phenylobacterium sp.]|uniref:hypothetical protein n=1 Tax=Phenylobacterium sp. TaxID=1871053 RepID=UPI0035AF78D5